MADMRFFRVVHYPTGRLLHETCLLTVTGSEMPYRVDPDRVVHAPGGVLVHPPWQIQCSPDEYEWEPLFTAKTRREETDD